MTKIIITEQVSGVLPIANGGTGASSLASITNPPQGYLINGLIVPTVTSNNLTVSLKTLAGTDATVANPISVRIGDTVRTITSALSATANSGTGWFSSSATELAGLEVDYFVYLGYSTGLSSVVLGFSRMPYHTDFSPNGFATTDTRFMQTVGGATGISFGENIGRFAATLSAGNLWSVPTFTSSNLINKPTFDTRWLSCVSSITAGGTMGITTQVFKSGTYHIQGYKCQTVLGYSFTTVAPASGQVFYTLPVPTSFSSAYESLGAGTYYNGSLDYLVVPSIDNVTKNSVRIQREATVNYTIGTSQEVHVNLLYQI